MFEIIKWLIILFIKYYQFKSNILLSNIYYKLHKNKNHHSYQNIIVLAPK
jgi:hypothetical protein